MTEPNNQELVCAETVAAIAIGMPSTVTSGEVLRALSQAWRAGYTDGFSDGVKSGQRAASVAIDAVMRALP